MNRAGTFERYWADFERPGRPTAESLPPPPELEEAVAVATALRQHGLAVPALDLDATWLSLAARLESGTRPVTLLVRPRVPQPRRAETHEAGNAKTDQNVIVLRPRLRWKLRVGVAAVAALVALATVSLQARPGSALYPVRLTVERAALALSPRDGSIYLRVAEARLGDLLASLRMGPVRAAPGVTRSLVVDRAAAGRARADLTDLDLRIALEVPPALRGAPSSIATAVRAILGDLLPSEELSPARGPAPILGPGEMSPEDKREPARRRHKDSGKAARYEGRERGAKPDGRDEGADEGSDSQEGSDSHEGSNDEQKGFDSGGGSDKEAGRDGPERSGDSRRSGRED